MSALPYAPEVWGLLCFQVGDSDAALEPGATPTNAQEALDAMPEGTLFRVLVREVPDASGSLALAALYDRSDQRRLSEERDLYPCLWLRIDSEADYDELATYDQLARYDRLETFEADARHALDAVVLLTPAVLPLDARELPALIREA